MVVNHSVGLMADKKYLYEGICVNGPTEIMNTVSFIKKLCEFHS